MIAVLVESVIVTVCGGAPLEGLMLGVAAPAWRLPGKGGSQDVLRHCS